MTFPAPVPKIPRGQRRQNRSLLCQHAGLNLRLGERPRRHCRHHQSLLPRVLRQHRPNLFWLNLGSKAEVDELFTQWKAAQAKMVSEPEDKPWRLREFMAADLDGNLIRVFYDFQGDI